jgi:hypothetical protein
MMSDKIELKEKLAAVDLGARDMWDAMDADQQKALKSEFFILNRYISNVSGQSRETQEHFVLTVNEFFNKHWFVLQKHPKLMWQLLCLCSHESKKIFFHQWMGFKQKKGDTKKLKLLMEIYPAKKQSDLELLADIMTTQELKSLLEQYGYSDKDIKKLI